MSIESGECETVVPARLPRYRIISESLLRDIAAGILTPGTRLPPERQMAADLGVAVGTLRHALGELTEQGFITRRQGSGNFVTSKKPMTSSYHYFRLESVDGHGMPTSEIISLDELPEPAPHDGLEGSRFWRLRRLRRIGTKPVAMEEVWIDADLMPDADAIREQDAGYPMYRSHFGVMVAEVEDRIGIGSMPGWTHDELGAAATRPCVVVDRIARDEFGRAVEGSRSWVDPVRARYVNRMR